MPFAACAGLLVASAACADSPARETKPIDAALAAPALREARVAALVVEPRSGRVLYARHPDRALVPASNMKLLTAVAVLSELGPAHRFVTRVYSDAPPDPSGAVGWLAVRGGGDPTLTSEQWWRLAADLRRAGLTHVRGTIWLDDSVFDAQRWHPDWGETSARAYHAPVSALSANYGAFAVTVLPAAAPEQPARVILDPPVDYLRLESSVTTAPSGARAQIAVERHPKQGFEVVRVTGRIPVGAEPETYWRSVSDATRYAGSVLRLQLAANGIDAPGPLRSGPVPAPAHELLEFDGRPLGEVVHLLSKYSSNVIAESLVKALGAQRNGAAGSWRGGMAVLQDRLVRLGLGLDGARLVDGSGLARTNRVSPRMLVDALRIAWRSFRIGPEISFGLPVAGGVGTLEKRLAGAPGAVRAKTGLLDRVVALSGFAEGGPEGFLVFSVLVNGYTGSDEAAMRALDRFAEAIVSLDGRAAR